MVRVQRRRSADERRIAVIDAGKSTTRAAVFDGAERLGQCARPVGFPHPESPGALEEILRGVGELLGSLGHHPYDVLVLAATGIRRIGGPESQVQSALSRRWECEVIIENDVVVAYLGALGPRAGMLMQAGTGSLIAAVAEDQPPVVLDGWGHLAGDRGSGFALGRAGLRAAYAAWDGTGPATALVATIIGTDPEQRIRALYAAESPIRAVAALAPTVLRAASDGDEVAFEVVDAVAAALVAQVLAAAKALGDPPLDALPVAGVGGLFEDGLFRATVERRLHALLPHAQLVPGAGGALEGGRLLATTRDEPFTHLLTSAFRNEES